ncbi:hypothetical protein PRVXH_000233 [Proteinivorax hydrogeniformans]|uniref:Uncharacterized protein n=1 Tax=Proteinivorax hydrogeniformans TaxID=1826727 RepID=A0AAU8HU71_9FIRM
MELAKQTQKSFIFCIIGLALISYRAISSILGSLHTFLSFGLSLDFWMLNHFIVMPVFYLLFAFVFLTMFFGMVNVINKDQFFAAFKSLALGMLLITLIVGMLQALGYLRFVFLGGDIEIRQIAVFSIQIFSQLFIALAVTSRAFKNMRYLFEPLFGLALAFNVLMIFIIIIPGYFYGDGFIGIRAIVPHILYIITWICFYFSSQWVLEHGES